jgi:hypothetical protein
LIHFEAPALAGPDRAAVGALVQTQDAGLAAVDAAFALPDPGAKPVAQLPALALPEDDGERQTPETPRVSWPLWFVLLVAAAGGGAVWQAAGQNLSEEEPRNHPAVG